MEAAMMLTSKSAAKLATCHPDLQLIVNELAQQFPIQVLCGERGEAEQDAAYMSGTSKAKWGESPHNLSPSAAVDLAPWPIDWNKINKFQEMAVMFKQIAQHHSIAVTWGGDFKTLKDMPHFELTNWKRSKI
jgi:peptidoglycan L-alanyl-D-glutamate endopeptidase CwlK